MLALPRRFYKAVDVIRLSVFEAKNLQAYKQQFLTRVFDLDPSIPLNELYAIHLDGRPLRTLANHELHLHSWPLAAAIAQEWRAQRDHIDRARMRLTGLAFTAIDNPLADTKRSLVDKVIEYLETDTLLYFAGEQESGRLLELQQSKWWPVIEYINRRNGLSLQPTRNVFDSPTVSAEDALALRRYLHSHSFAALSGLLYGVEATKSLLVVLAASTHHLDIDEAVNLARLEQIFQTNTWGNVEWCHDIEHQELSNRLSAAILFTNLSSNYQVLLNSENSKCTATEEAIGEAEGATAS